MNRLGRSPSAALVPLVSRSPSAARVPDFHSTETNTSINASSSSRSPPPRRSRQPLHCHRPPQFQSLHRVPDFLCTSSAPLRSTTVIENILQLTADILKANNRSMGKKGSSKKVPTTTSGPQMSVTIREASTGKKHTNAKSSLKLQHIKNLAVWASCDAAIPLFGAFFGHHFAASSEALGTPVDPSLFTCQRCESILQPGYNCTIRIEKNKTSVRRKGKKATRNNIVYTCHFCSHQNMKRGTPRNTSPSEPKANSNPKPMTSRFHEPPSTTKPKPGNTVSYETIVANAVTAPPGSTADDLDKIKTGIVEKNETLKIDITKDNLAANTEANSLAIAENPMGKVGISETSETSEVKNDSAASGPSTPLTRPTLTLLESKMRKRKRSGAKKAALSESTCEAPNAEKSVNTSNRRRRKSWTSLKEIAESNENDKRRRLMNLTVPFSMQ